jgi:hypothetical protein
VEKSVYTTRYVTEIIVNTRKAATEHVDTGKCSKNE